MELDQYSNNPQVAKLPGYDGCVNGRSGRCCELQQPRVVDIISPLNAPQPAGKAGDHAQAWTGAAKAADCWMFEAPRPKDQRLDHAGVIREILQWLL